MTEIPNFGVPTFDTAKYARDWVTIWQSEWSAAATDRERIEAWSRWMDAGSEAALACLPFQPDEPAGPAATPPPARSATADAATDAERAIASLARRVDELERRLAAREAPASG